MSAELEEFSDELHAEKCLKALQDVLNALSDLERSDRVRIINCVDTFYALEPHGAQFTHEHRSTT